MTAELRFRVTGEPGAQGSKTAFRSKTGKTILTESSKKVKPWRQDVVAAAEKAAAEQGWQPLPQVRAVIVFGFRRPKSHYRTGRNASILRDNAPTWHSNRPDGDKLLRSTLDALATAGVLGDDSRVVEMTAYKIWVHREQPTGALVVLTTPSMSWVADAQLSAFYSAPNRALSTTAAEGRASR
jgi:crossover junction endodeoxyribonuclease RusA